MQTEANYKYYIIFNNAQRSLLATSISLGSGPGADLAVLEAPAAQVRITDPPPGWVFGRAQPHRTESLRRGLRSSQRLALRLCPTGIPPISRPGAFYPSRRPPNAELWVRSFQLLPHSSADPSIHGPELDVLGSCDRGSPVTSHVTLLLRIRIKLAI